MSDPCDRCNRPYCHCCEHADSEETEEHITKERKEYLINQIHQAEQIVWWLSYQPEMLNSGEHYQLERMHNFLENMRKRLE